MQKKKKKFILVGVPCGTRQQRGGHFQPIKLTFLPAAETFHYIAKQAASQAIDHFSHIVPTIFTMASISHSFLLNLPRELRDEIYLLLILHEHVFTSSEHPDRSLRRHNKLLEAYIDTRVYVPMRAPANLLGTCRQLRDECLDTVCHLINSSTPYTRKDPQPNSEPKSTRIAALHNSDLEETVERSKDNGSVRVTLEVARPIRGNMGAVFPKRERPSPCLLALVPFLSRVKKIKFTVWAAYDWWRGPQQRYMITGKRQVSSVKRTSSDETDETVSTQEKKSRISPVPVSTEANPLANAIDSILKYMPLIEVVEVDVLMYAQEYFNWDLPNDRSEGLRGWLDTTVRSQDGKIVKEVHRRLIACEPNPRSRGAIFYHQREVRGDEARDSTSTSVYVSTGFGVVRELYHKP